MFNFFYWLFFFESVDLLFFTENGLDINQITLLTIIYSIAGLIFQIPVGILADKYSRKNLIIFSAILSLLSVWTYLQSHTFAGLALGMCLYSLREVFWYASSNSFIYDYLKEEESSQGFEKITSIAETLGLVALSVGGVIGSFIASYNIRETYKFSLFVAIALILISLFLDEPARNSEKLVQSSTSQKGENDHFTHFKRSLKYLKKNSRLQYIIYFYLIIQIAYSFIDEFDQIFLQDMNLPIQFFGFWMIGRNFLNSIGSILTSKLKKMDLFNYNYQISILLLTILGLISFGFLSGMMMIVSFSALFFILGFGSVLSTSKLHQVVADQYRSTVESLSNLAVLIVDIPTRLIFAYISSTQGISTGFVFLGFCILIYLIIWLPFYTKSSAKTGVF